MLGKEITMKEIHRFWLVFFMTIGLILNMTNTAGDLVEQGYEFFHDVFKVFMFILGGVLTLIGLRMTVTQYRIVRYGVKSNWQ